MFKIHLHIHAPEDFIDRQVYVPIELPFVPQKGDYLYVPEELLHELENKARRNPEIAKRYAPKWFYHKSFGVRFPTEENLPDLSFTDAHTVHAVAYQANSEIIHIEITD